MVPALRRPPLRVWIWTAATVVLAVVAVLLWRGSDAAATSSSTARAAPPVPGSPAATASQAWSVAAGPVPGAVVERNRVVVGSAHGVAALDPRTGREAWHYTRANARLCGVTAVDDLALAVFEVPSDRHRCDQMVALSVDTGVRRWTRNVNLRTDATLISTPRTAVAVDPTGVVAIDPTGDNIRWRYQAPAGCRLSTVAGSAGIAVVQQCGDRAAQLRLLDAFSGSPRWTRDFPAGTAVRPVGADSLVSLVVGDSLQLYAGQDGVGRPAVALPAGPDGVGETGTDAAVLVEARGTLFSLDPGTGGVRWQVPATGLPGEPVRATIGSATESVAVPEQGAFVLRDPVSGVEQGRATVSGVPGGGVATRVGDVVVLRLADRVIGYR